MEENNNDSNDIYFAAKDPIKTAGILMEKSTSFFNSMQTNSYCDKLKDMWKAYYGIYGTDSDHKISFSGEQGEYVSLPVNHFSNLARHIYVMITANRPIMQARAINTDYKSLSQTYLANGILDYYMREKHLEDALKNAVEMAIVLGSGFIKMEWNATAGEMYDADDETGETQYEGEIEFANLSPLDVVFDGTKESFNHDWYLCRTFKNRFDLSAKYPEFKDKILGKSTKSDSSIYRMSMFSNDDTDDIAVYEFFHKRTEALPDGRYMLFVDGDIVLLDAKLPYRTMPLFRIAPATIMGTPYGYSPMFDIFPIQEAINTLYSTIMTNQSQFGVQNLFVPDNSNLVIESLDGGMNIIKGNAPPEPLQLTNTPKEVFDFLNLLITSAETISGVNSTTRGNPEASLKSGTSLALVQSMSLQFVSGLQQSYIKMIEDVGTALIAILKDFAMTPKVIALVGRNNRTLLKEFTGDKISAINRVIVDVGNPLANSIAGRVEMAEQMMQMGIIKDARKYYEVLTTGRLDAAYEGEMDELLLIKRENELLLEGAAVQCSPLDQHSQHIAEHRAVLADPDLRTDFNLVRSVMDHIQDHMDALRNTDPALLQMIGENPLPPAAPMALPVDPNAPPPAPGEAPQAGPPPAMEGSAAGPLQGQEALPQAGQQVSGEVGGTNLPGLPKVDPNLLPNPGLQQNAMGNVRQ